MDFDPQEPLDVCVRRYCGSDADCPEDQVCDLRRFCSAACQIDADCGDNICADGTCQAASVPQNTVRCVLLSRDDVLLAGAEKVLVGAALDESAQTLSRVTFRFVSSNSEVIAVEGDRARGGERAGSATITAFSEMGLACAGAITVHNYLPIGAGLTRVVVADELGRPVVGAPVTRVIGDVVTTTASNARGEAIFNGDSFADEINVAGPGYQLLSILSPGGRDLVVELPRNTATLEPTGFGGSVKLLSEKPRDASAGLVSAPLSGNPFGFDLASNLCGTVTTPLDIPELGATDENFQAFSSEIFRFGRHDITDDSAAEDGGVRCRGRAPEEGELGCYLAPSLPGPVLAWSFAGEVPFYRLTAAGSGSLFSSSCEAGTVDQFVRLEKNVLAPLAHGVGVAEGAAPYSHATLSITTPKSITASILLPGLSNSTGPAQDTVVVLAGALVPDQGLIPLGSASGYDGWGGTGPSDGVRDGVIDGSEQPFGPASAALPPGQIPLFMAPPHGVLAGRPLTLIAMAITLARGRASSARSSDRARSTASFMAFDSLTPFGDAGRGVSAMVHTTARVEPKQSIGTEFLPMETARLDPIRRRILFSGVSQFLGTRMVRIEANGQVWRIYAPASSQPLAVPRILGADSLLMDPNAKLRSGYYESAVNYSEHFRLGSVVRPKDALSAVTRFSISEMTRL